ncbi:MAG: hypothetical protein WDZ93_01440 [Candidatus Paceibacterota bacterium]
MFSRIRKKPRHVRQQFAFWYAIGATSVIALVWGVSLQYRLADTLDTDSTVDDEYTGAFSQFLGDAKDNFANIFSAVGTTTPEEEANSATSTPTTTPFELTPRATSSASSTNTARPVRIQTDSEHEETGTE